MSSRGALHDFTHFLYYHRTMTRQFRLDYEGTLYHITSRGKAPAAIYLNDEGRTGFLGVLRSCFKISRLT
jgi:hypothetical protein